jgi:integrase
MSAYHIMLDYVKLIPLADRTGRVWKRWVDKKGGGYFSTAQPVGKNNFTKLLRELFLECLSVLPEQIQWEEQNQRRKDGCQDPGTRFGIGRFTSHSARRTMTTIAAASESISNTELQRLGRWSNALTMERYKDNNSAVRINTQKKLGAIFTLDVGNLHAGTATGVTAVMSDPAKALAELGLVFNNCTVSITINRDTAAQ